MKVEILQNFSGFPDGVEKPEKSFVSGETVEVGNDFGKMIVEKGLARLLPAKSSSSKAEAANEAE